MSRIKLFLLTFALMLGGVAYAQVAPIVTPIVPIDPALLSLIVVGLGAASALIRRIVATSADHFLHTTAGAASTMFAAFLLGGLGASIQQGGLTKTAIYAGIASAISSLVGWFSPQGSTGKSPGSSAPTGTAVAALLLCFAVLSLSGCSYCQQPANKSTTECKAFNAVEKCGPGAAAILVRDIPLLIAGQYEQVFVDIESSVPAEAVCIENAIDSQAAAVLGADSPELKVYMHARALHLAKRAALVK